MSSKAYIVPTDNLTFMDQANYRLGALAAGIARCYFLGISNWDMKMFPAAPNPDMAGTPTISSVAALLKAGAWPRDLDVREFEQSLDAGAGAAVDFWFTAALGPIGTEVSCLGAAPIALAANRIKKLVVFYKVGIDTIPNPVSRLLFRRNTATGLLQAEFDLDQLNNQIRMDGYFSEPVIWDNNTAYAVNALPRIATGVAARIILGNFVFEPAGTTNV